MALGIVQPAVERSESPRKSCPRKRNGGAAEDSGTAAPGEVTDAGWLLGAVGTWAQLATHSNATRPVTYPRCRMAVECRTCLQSVQPKPTGRPGSRTCVTFHPSAVSRCRKRLY